MTEQDSSQKVDNTIRKAECSQCGGLRNCHIRGKHSESSGDEDFSFHTNWYLLQCCGCEHVFAQTISTNSEDYNECYEINGNTQTIYNKTIRYWPALSKRKQPDWFFGGFIDADDAHELALSLTELYSALNNDLNMLAAIGIRTSVDVAAMLLGVDPDLPFKSKLEALKKAGDIGKVDQARLAALVDAGSASAHRGWRPSPKELNTMMDVLEHFIHEAFVRQHAKSA